MDLLLYDEEKQIAIIHPSIYTIDEFNKIIRRDKRSQRNSENILARKELAYIYLMVHHSSPYISLDIDLRQSSIIDDIFSDSDNWEPDEIINLALVKYKKLYETPEIRLLISVLGAIESMADYFNDIDWSARDNKMGLLYNPKDVAMAMAKLGGMIETVVKLKNDVEKSILGVGDTMGGIQLGRYNE